MHRQRSALYPLVAVVPVLAACASTQAVPPPSEPRADMGHAASGVGEARGGQWPAREVAGAGKGTGTGKGTTTTTAGACPVDVPGTTVIVAPFEDAAGLLFVARNARTVPEVRRRVRALARTQNRAAWLAPGDPAPSAVIEAAGAEAPREPTVTVFDIERGAVLRFAPSELDQLGELHAHVLEYAQRMAGGSCPLIRDEVSLLPASRRRGPEPGELPAVPPGIIPGTSGVHGVSVMPGPLF